MQQLSRRSLITGLIPLVAAPAIVRASNLMPVKVIHEHPIFAGIDLGSQEMVTLVEMRYRECVWIMTQNLERTLYYYDGKGVGGLAELVG